MYEFCLNFDSEMYGGMLVLLLSSIFIMNKFLMSKYTCNFVYMCVCICTVLIFTMNINFRTPHRDNQHSVHFAHNQVCTCCHVRMYACTHVLCLGTTGIGSTKIGQ